MYFEESQLSAFDRSSKNGMRCVIYPDRQKIPENVFDPFEVFKRRNLSEEQPVLDDIFAIYRQQFQYDDLPLNPNIELRDDSPEDWIMEKISFNAAYENERMIAYLFLPKDAKPPYQSMIWYPGAYALFNPTFPDWWFQYYCGYLLKNGIAVITPIYKCTYQRGSPIPGECYQIAQMKASHQYATYLIKWIKDLSRSLDYLETRQDFDPRKVGLYTHSWGGKMGAIIPAMEERVKICVHVLGGFGNKTLPEVDQLNYITRVKIPVLMLNGEYDLGLSLEDNVKPFYNLHGRAEVDKMLKIYESDHWIPKDEMIRETLGWLEKYFGPVNK